MNEIYFTGRESMTNQQIAENIIELLKQLGSLHPGGTNNIFKLHLKPNVNISVSVPLYINTGKLFDLNSVELSFLPSAPNREIFVSFVRKNSILF